MIRTANSSTLTQEELHQRSWTQSHFQETFNKENHNTALMLSQQVRNLNPDPTPCMNVHTNLSCTLSEHELETELSQPLWYNCALLARSVELWIHLQVTYLRRNGIFRVACLFPSCQSPIFFSNNSNKMGIQTRNVLFYNLRLLNLKNFDGNLMFTSSLIIERVTTVFLVLAFSRSWL